MNEKIIRNLKRECDGLRMCNESWIFFIAVLIIMILPITAVLRLLVFFISMAIFIYQYKKINDLIRQAEEDLNSIFSNNTKKSIVVPKINVAEKVTKVEVIKEPQVDDVNNTITTEEIHKYNDVNSINEKNILSISETIPIVDTIKDNNVEEYNDKDVPEVNNFINVKPVKRGIIEPAETIDLSDIKIEELIDGSNSNNIKEICENKDKDKDKDKEIDMTSCIRKLPKGRKASEKARLLALEYGYILKEGETFIKPKK